MKHFEARLWVLRFSDLESRVLGFRDVGFLKLWVWVFVRPRRAESDKDPFYVNSEMWIRV